MEPDERIDFHELEVDAEKTSLLILVSVVFFGAAIAGSITLNGGNIVRAMLSADIQSQRWAGLSGSIDGERNDTPESFYSWPVDDAQTGQTHEQDFRGLLDQRHYFAVLPFDGSEFEEERIGNLSLSDVDAGGIFDQEDFPVFYEDPGYAEILDAPNDTFKDTEKITVLEQPYQALETTLHDGVPMYLLSYQVNGEEQPLFLSSLENYSSCYDGKNCNYQFMLPDINGSSYHFYQLAEIRPTNVTVLIDGEKKRTFPYPARPYNLTIITRDIFNDNQLFNRQIRISEREGNNVFTPAISSSNYSSEAEIVTSTDGGKKTMLFAPTKYSSPGGYQLSIEIMTPTGQVGQEERLFVDRGSIEFTNQGPTEKDFPYLETEYKKGVNHLRPIASCLFTELSQGDAFRLELNSSDSGKTLVRGLPYVADLENSQAAYFRLEEPSSHLVMFPAGGNDTSTVHLPADENPFRASSKIAFTPTVLKSEDSGLSIELLDAQEDLLHEINLNVKGATCGTPVDGVETSAPYLKSFKKRVNSIRPVLNSLFVAGN